MGARMGSLGSARWSASCDDGLADTAPTAWRCRWRAVRSAACAPVSLIASTDLPRAAFRDAALGSGVRSGAWSTRVWGHRRCAFASHVSSSSGSVFGLQTCRSARRRARRCTQGGSGACGTGRPPLRPTAWSAQWRRRRRRADVGYPTPGRASPILVENTHVCRLSSSS